MARIRMVTRTVKGATLEVMALNTDTCEVVIQHYTVSGPAPVDPKAWAKFKAAHDTESVTLVKLTSHTPVEVLYGMPEDEFIANATVLPPRTVTNEDDTNE